MIQNIDLSIDNYGTAVVSQVAALTNVFLSSFSYRKSLVGLIRFAASLLISHSSFSPDGVVDNVPTKSPYYSQLVLS